MFVLFNFLFSTNHRHQQSTFQTLENTYTHTTNTNKQNRLLNCNTKLKEGRKYSIEKNKIFRREKNLIIIA